MARAGRLKKGSDDSGSKMPQGRGICQLDMKASRPKGKSFSFSDLFYLSCQQKLLPTGMMGLSTLIKWGRSLTVRPVTYLLAGSESTHINNQEHPLRRISPNSPDFIGLMRLMFWPPKLQEHRRASLPDSPYFYSQTLLREESGEQAGDSPLVSTWPWFLLT